MTKKNCLVERWQRELKRGFLRYRISSIISKLSWKTARASGSSLQWGKNYNKKIKNHQNLITSVKDSKHRTTYWQTSLSKAKRAQARGLGNRHEGNAPTPLYTSKGKNRDPTSLLRLGPPVWEGPDGHITALLTLLSPLALTEQRGSSGYEQEKMARCASQFLAKIQKQNRLGTAMFSLIEQFKVFPLSAPRKSHHIRILTPRKN